MMQLQPWTGRESFFSWRRAAGMAALTPEQVRAIRKSKEPNEALAKRYGVSVQVLQKARRRATYKWVE